MGNLRSIGSQLLVDRKDPQYAAGEREDNLAVEVPLEHEQAKQEHVDRHSFPALDHVQLRDHQIPEPPVVDECKNFIQQSHHGAWSGFPRGTQI